MLASHETCRREGVVRHLSQSVRVMYGHHRAVEYFPPAQFLSYHR